ISYLVSRISYLVSRISYLVSRISYLKYLFFHAQKRAPKCPYNILQLVANRDGLLPNSGK
ncbi:hypothetical protein, partial [Vibrio sp. NC2]|uniref:hypothetical protein n=1 Tax=Vibrio sp. NC2 TaxID=2974562 RepID=UPI0021A2BBAF